MKITKPGLYKGILTDDYFADPCITPSLSQSIAKLIIDRSPLHGKFEHPRLAPVRAEDDEFERYDKAKAIGNAAHKIILGRGKDLEIIRSNDFRNKAAKEARDAAYKAGKEPVLEKHLETATVMVASALAQLERHEASDAFKNGAGEVVLVWQEDGIWFRQMVDWLHDDLRTVDDMKTTGLSVAPHSLGMMMVNAGWDVQAAMAERGLDVLDPAGAGRRRFRFIAQENNSPYALTVAQMGEAALTMGRKKLQVAVDIWRECIESGEWPGYINRVVVPEYPGFAEYRWLEREVNEFSQPIKRGSMLKSLMGG
jgi:hypothetical protein